MAAKTEVSGGVKPPVKSAEDWALAKKIPGMYLAGVKTQNHWRSGKTLTEKEFDAALKAFLSGTADGRKK